jgi:hypothetical protein
MPPARPVPAKITAQLMTARVLTAIFQEFMFSSRLQIKCHKSVVYALP